jgi:heat shock protein HtpX
MPMRRVTPRDPWLALRMVVVLLLATAWYASVPAGFVALFVWIPAYWWLWGLIAGVLGFSLLRQYGNTEQIMLRPVGGRIVELAEEPDLHRLVERVSAMLDIAKPRVGVADSEVPNALAISTRPSRSVVVFTEGLRRLLDQRELEAVAAHELAHLVHRDGTVMTFAGVPRTAGQLLVTGEGVWLWGFLWPFGFVVYGFGSLLTLALSRYREFAADRLAAVATGEPEYLMSALQKVSDRIARIPRSDLRAVGALNAFFIVPVEREPTRWWILADHPPLAKRLEHLARIERELGKAVA